MAILRSNMIDDDGSGTTGTIINQAWKQEFYDQIDAYVGGAWVDVPYNAATYTALSATWTVPSAAQQTLMYAISANTVQVAFMISGAQTLSVASGQLYITLPAVVPTITRALYHPFSYYAGGGGTGTIELAFGQRKLTLLRDLAGTLWPAQSNATGIYSGVVTYRYQ